MVHEYRLARLADEQRRAEETLEYQTEMENYDGPIVNFKSWLEGHPFAQPPERC
jgi:hypothetical protein